MTDLENLRQALERSAYRPAEKSAMSRDLVESEMRLGAVIEACSARVYATAV